MPDRREDRQPGAMGHRNRRGLLVFLLVLMLGIPAGITAWHAIQDDTALAPDFTLTDTGYRNGTAGDPETFSLSDFRGSTVVIDFMAYNCPSCRFVTPKLETLYHDVEPEVQNGSVVFLTIDVGKFTNFPGSSTENLIKWQNEEYDSPWRHALDEEGVFLDYADACFGGIPCLFVIGEDGAFVFQNTGIPSTDRMQDVIAQSGRGEAMTVSVVSVGVLGLALIAGLASFFAPCSIGLIPAYMGFLLNQQSDRSPMRDALRGGLTTAAGIVSLYGVLAVILWWASDLLAPIIPKLGLIVGIMLIAFGALMFFGGAWDRLAQAMGMGKVDGRKGFFAFGIGYGLAAFGCTGPVFLPVLVAGFAEGAAIGFASFAIYAVAVASFVVFAAYLVAAGRTSRLKAILSRTTLITRISATLLILAGAYLVWFDVTAFG